MFVRIPIAPTRGYINLGDVAVFFYGIHIRPVYSSYFRRTWSCHSRYSCRLFTVGPRSHSQRHGLQGFAAALVIRALAAKKFAEPVAGLAGMVVMVGLYLLGGAFMVGFRGSCC